MVRGLDVNYTPSDETADGHGLIDAASHKLLLKIQLPTGSLPMGTAMATDGKELYVSTGRGNAIVVVDTQKNAVATTIPVGNRVWGIALDPSGSKLYTANGASNDVSVVDVKSRKELRRIKVGDGPWGITSIRAAKSSVPINNRIIHRRTTD